MSLRAINQNLIPVLLALLRERNVTRAARRLAMSQPAMSKALTQLRATLDDELLVRAGRGLVLTRRGEDLLGPVAAICADLERLWRPQTFDPALSTRQFVIAGTDYCAMLLVPALASTLAREAAGVSMRFVDLGPQQLMEDRSDIDFAMIPDFIIPPQILETGGVMPLFVDDFVVVVAKDHPMAKDPDRVSAHTASIAFANDDPLLPKELRGTMPTPVSEGSALAIVRQFLSLPILALLTGAQAVVPRRLVDLISPIITLHVVEGLVPPRPVQMVLAWPKRRDGDADHRWFRERVATAMSKEQTGPISP